MSNMSRNSPRRPSRTTTPRPRKIAGRDEAAEPRVADTGRGGEGTSDDTLPPGHDPAPPSPPRPPRRPVAQPPAGEGDGKPAGRGSGRTSTLLALVGLVVLVLVAQCGWFVWNTLRDEKVATTVSDTTGDRPGIAVPEGRPVVLNQLAVQEGVDAAAAAAQIMFARNWKSYDDGVENALDLMTEQFAEEYRATTEDVKKDFVAKKTSVEVRVVAQSVVRANDTELEALIFLNQYVFRGEGKNAKSTYTPYRAVLTMVHTDDGWLVDGVATK